MSLLLTVRANWRAQPGEADEENTVSALAELWAQDSWAWQFPGNSPLLETFAVWPWIRQEGQLPWLDSEKLRGYLAVTVAAGNGTLEQIKLGTHNFDVSALCNMRALFEAGISREPVDCLTTWALRVEDFVKAGKISLTKLQLTSAHFVPNCMHPESSPITEASHKLLWIHHVSMEACAMAHSSKRAVVWAELSILVGDVSTIDLQGQSSKASALSWALVSAVAEVDPAVKANMRMCEKAPHTLRTNGSLHDVGRTVSDQHFAVLGTF
jgi:hypothetical protein